MMESSVPFDTSEPAVRDYLALVRLQVLTPLSLLVNIVTIVVCAAVLDPSLTEIANDYRTVLTPKAWMVQMYIIAIWVGQIGYCLLLVLARKPETKQTLIHGSGQWLVWANWVIAGWAVAFILQGFLVATILLGIALVLLIFSNLVLVITHPPTTHRPLDIALIHAPLRLSVILPFMILFPYTLFIALGWYWVPGTPQAFTHHQWTAFGIVLGTNLLGLVIIVFRRDIVWTIGAAWLNAALFSQRPKPAPVYITSLVFAIIFPLALLASYMLLRLRHPRVLEDTKPSNDPHPSSGPIHLPTDEEAGIAPQGRPAPAPFNDQAAAAREVDAEAVWG